MNEALEAVELNYDDTSSEDSDSDADDAAWRCVPEKQKIAVRVSQLVYGGGALAGAALV